MVDENADLRNYGNAIGFYNAVALLRSAPNYEAYRLGVLTPMSAWLAFSIEFSLKSFLLHKGSTEKALAVGGVRHNLVVLLDEAKSAGLSVDPNFQGIVNEISPNHNSHFYRYMPEHGNYHDFHNWPYIMQLIDRHLAAVGTSINAVRRQEIISRASRLA